MERICWHFVGFHDVQNFLPRPVEQRIELEQAAFGVELDYSHSGTMRRLVAAQAGDPGPGAGQGPVERLDLADMAARGAGLPGAVALRRRLANPAANDSEVERLPS